MERPSDPLRGQGPLVRSSALQDLLAAMTEHRHVGSLLETAMRGLILAFASTLTLAASGQAARLAPNPSMELGTAPPTELVRDGCGRGYHRTHWRDQMGQLAVG